MKKTTIWILLFLSLFFTFYSVKQILASKEKVNGSLKEWESKLLKEKVTVPKNFNAGTTIKEKIPVVPTYYNDGEVIGKIILLGLNKELPIVEGTDDNDLEKGVGHYIGTAYPGQENNTVLAGHRDTVFRDLDKVKIGDIISIQTGDGTYAYKITSQEIVDQDNQTVIKPSKQAIVTLITCYPFHYVGPAPKRYILTGNKIKE